MDFLKKNKVLIGGGIAIALGIYSYLTFYSGGSEAVITSDQTVSPASQELLSTLGRLNTLTLDESIFTDPVFNSLSDFGVTIPPQTVGRRNPFAPIGSTAPTGTTTQPTPEAQ